MGSSIAFALSVEILELSIETSVTAHRSGNMKLSGHVKATGNRKSMLRNTCQ